MRLSSSQKLISHFCFFLSFPFTPEKRQNDDATSFKSSPSSVIQFQPKNSIQSQRKAFSMPSFTHEMFKVEENIITSVDFSKIKENIKATQLFRVGDNWKDYDFLMTTVSDYAGRIGFDILKSSTCYLVCSRAKCGRTQPKISRNYSSGPLKCGCDFKITVKPSCNIQMKSRSRPNFGKNLSVTISFAFLDHTNGCQPCPLHRNRELFQKKTRDP